MQHLHSIPSFCPLHRPSLHRHPVIPRSCLLDRASLKISANGGKLKKPASRCLLSYLKHLQRRGDRDASGLNALNHCLYPPVPASDHHPLHTNSQSRNSFCLLTISFHNLNLNPSSSEILIFSAFTVDMVKSSWDEWWTYEGISGEFE